MNTSQFRRPRFPAQFHSVLVTSCFPVGTFFLLQNVTEAPAEFWQVGVANPFPYTPERIDCLLQYTCYIMNYHSYR